MLTDIQKSYNEAAEAAVQRIQEQYKEHHTAWCKGYISRKTPISIEPYNGKFGKGYKVHKASYSSTNYHTVTYYVE